MSTTTIGTIQLIATIDTSQYEKGAKKVNEANASMEKSTEQVAGKSEQVAQASVKSFSKIEKVAIGGVIAAAVAAGAAIIKNIGGAISRVDTLNNFPSVMENLGYGADESTAAIRKLDKGVQGLPTSLDAIASAMQNIAPSARSLDEATELTLALNNALIAGGKDAGLQSTAMEQFSQAIAKGKPDMMEWRSLATAMPGQLKQISNSLGFDNWQAMAQAVTDGELAFTDVQKAIIDLNKNGLGQFPSFADQAKKATGGLKTSIAQMNTAITRGIAGVINTIGADNITNAITSIGKAFETALNGFKSFITFVKNNSTLFKTLAIVIGTVVTGMIAYTTYMKLAAAASAATAAVTGTVTLALSLQAQGLGILRAAWLALNIVMNANPIGLVIGVVVGLVAAIAALSFATGKTSEEERKLNEQRSKSIELANRLKDSENNLKDARFQQESAALRVEEAQRRLDETIRQYGKDSLEARRATLDLKGAQSELETTNDNVKSAVQENTQAINDQRREMDELNKRLENMNGKSFTYYIQGVEHVAQDYGKQGKYVTPTFSSGGFTGRGGKYQEAGIVHKGEYVLPQNLVNQSTGLPDLDKLTGGSGGNIEYNISNINISSEVDGERWLRRLTDDSEVVSHGLVPQQKYMGA